jgi:hypothetical protein
MEVYMEHWLGNAKIERSICEALRLQSNVGCRPVTAMVWHLMHREGLVQAGQIWPDENCVYVSLSNLVANGMVEKYADILTGGIRYRLSQKKE